MQRYAFKNMSEYVRSALDFFDARRYNASKNNEIAIIQECITILQHHKKDVEKNMMKETLNELNENIKNQNHKNKETLKELDENLKQNIKCSEKQSLKELDENIKRQKNNKRENRVIPMESVIQTLIRITHVKGRPSDHDFSFQAKRCGKSKKELIDFYDENYDYFTKESDKYM